MNQPVQNPIHSSPVVYLSAHGKDTASAGILVRDALVAQGFVVLQEGGSVRTPTQCKRHYGPALNRCDAVVQLVGRDAGAVLVTDEEEGGVWSLGTWEAHEARKLRKPLNHIVLADDFPFDPSSGAPQPLKLERKQGAYRRKLVAKHADVPQAHDHEELIKHLLAAAALVADRQVPPDEKPKADQDEAAHNVEGIPAVAPAPVEVEAVVAEPPVVAVLVLEEEVPELVLAVPVPEPPLPDDAHEAVNEVACEREPDQNLPPPAVEISASEVPSDLDDQPTPAAVPLDEVVPGETSEAACASDLVLPEAESGPLKEPLLAGEPVVENLLLPKPATRRRVAAANAVPEEDGPMLPDVCLATQSGLATRYRMPMKMEFTRVSPKLRHPAVRVVRKAVAKDRPAPVVAKSTVQVREQDAQDARGAVPRAESIQPVSRTSSSMGPVKPAAAQSIPDFPYESFLWPSEQPAKDDTPRMSSFWIANAGHARPMADLPTHIRTTLLLVTASFCISVLLLVHAGWQHFHRDTQPVVIVEQRGPAGTSMADIQAERITASALVTMPEEVEETTGDAVSYQPILPPLEEPKQARAAFAGPVTDKVAVMQPVSLEQQQENLEKELEAMIIGRRQSGASLTAFAQSHARELGSLRRRLQAFKAKFSARDPYYSPRLLQLSRDIASVHLLSLEFQAARNVLLDSRESSFKAYGEKHEQVRLLDHLLIEAEKLEKISATSMTASPDPAQSISMSTKPAPMSPSEMAVLMGELKAGYLK